jgi:hypothetical protein
LIREHNSRNSVATKAADYEGYTPSEPGFDWAGINMILCSMILCARSGMQAIACHMHLLHSSCSNVILVNKDTVQTLPDLEGYTRATEAWNHHELEL